MQGGHGALDMTMEEGESEVFGEPEQGGPSPPPPSIRIEQLYRLPAVCEEGGQAGLTGLRADSVACTDVPRRFSRVAAHHQL
jgi:hypothetical protein